MRRPQPPRQSLPSLPLRLQQLRGRLLRHRRLCSQRPEFIRLLRRQARPSRPSLLAALLLLANPARRVLLLLRAARALRTFQLFPSREHFRQPQCHQLLLQLRLQLREPRLRLHVPLLLAPYPASPVRHRLIVPLPPHPARRDLRVLRLHRDKDFHRVLASLEPTKAVPEVRLRA